MTSTEYFTELASQLGGKLPHEFTKTCFAIFDQSPNLYNSCGKDCFYFSGNLLLPFLLWHDFKIVVKSRGRGNIFSCLPLSNNNQQKYFFSIKAKCPIFHCLNLDGRILNFICLKIRRKAQNLQNFRSSTPPRKYPKFSGKL